MRPLPAIASVLLLVLLASQTPPTHAQTPAQTPLPTHTEPSPRDQDILAIQHLMGQQTTDWNRGDIESFATGYKNSPDILFVGHTVSRGYREMLDRYRKSYPTPAAMGTLSFSELDVVLLDARFATATGNFHLERAPAGGGNADGIFSLVFEKTPDGWKIIRDHTTAFTPSKP